MTEPPVSPLGTTSTLPLPPPSVNGYSPPPSPAPSPPKAGRMHTRVSGMRTSLIAAAAGTARITQLRRIMRRDRRTPPAS
jgi:hypothetical protein